MERGRGLEGCIFSPTRCSPSLNDSMKISVCFVREGECKATHLKCKKYSAAEFVEDAQES